MPERKRHFELPTAWHDEFFAYRSSTKLARSPVRQGALRPAGPEPKHGCPLHPLEPG
jgi:hypothetical protein